MNTAIRRIVTFLKSEDGPTAFEYGVMLSLIVVVCVATVTTVGSNTSSLFQKVANSTAH